MKRKTSKEILAESFREVAEHKNIDKITVKDIVDNCGYSSATFYRQFRDKYDLIAWDYTRELEGIAYMQEANFQSLKDIVEKISVLNERINIDISHYERKRRKF